MRSLPLAHSGAYRRSWLQLLLDRSRVPNDAGSVSRHSARVDDGYENPSGPGFRIGFRSGRTFFSDKAIEPSNHLPKRFARLRVTTARELCNLNDGTPRQGSAHDNLRERPADR
jgi:hypothetical protein